MGHFSHNCKLTGLPITGGTPAVLIVMKPVNKLFDNSEEKLKKYGSTYMCSNEGTRLKFIPVWFPIVGKYDDYGCLEDIVEDDNTKALEEHYGLTIQELVNIVCSGRKDDGFDDDLKVIKVPVERPADMLDGEKHFNYYQRIMNDPMPCDGHYPDMSGKFNEKWQEEGYEGWTVWRKGKKVKATKEEYDADFKIIHDHYARYNKWKETNPDVEDDYGKPQYKEEFKELLTYSGMWVHGDVYEQLTDHNTGGYFDKLDMGRPEVLNALGFVEGEKTNAERYNRPFTHGQLTVMSDGNWCENQIYSLKDLQKLADDAGEVINTTAIEGKGRVEQLYDLVLPTFGNNKGVSKEALKYFNSISEKKLKESYKEKGKEGETFQEFKDAFLLSIASIFDRRSDSDMEMYSYFLNTEMYGSTRITNPMCEVYIEHAKKGKLRDNLVRFWRFDHYMFSCGRYYEIVGTSPQDGEHKDVMKVLTIAKDILTKTDYYEDEED